MNTPPPPYPPGWDFAHTETAELDRMAKARKIAQWCWDHHVTPGDLEDHVIGTHLAQRVAHAVDVHKPSTRATWAIVVSNLDARTAWAEANPGEPRAQRSSTRPEWFPGTGTPDPAAEHGSSGETGAPCDDADVAEPRREGYLLPPRVAANGPSDPAAEATPTDIGAARDEADVAEPRSQGAAHHPGFAANGPKGWHHYAALPPLPTPGHTCTTCGDPAVMLTPTRGHCPNHPPTENEWGAKMSFNWPPRNPCSPTRCYCGRCPNHPTPALNRAQGDTP